MGRKPIYRSHGDRYREGVTSIWASIAELENLDSDAKGKSTRC